MELRKDFLTQEWVCISELRGLRPTTFKREKNMENKNKGGDCPFCLENRHLTPEDIFILDDIRVIPNKYPAIDSENSEGYGFHEVIIDSPKHDYSMTDGDTTQLVKLLKCLQHRFLHFKENERIKYIQLFKNHGLPAGASIYHSHWQLMALPFVPFLKEVINNNFINYKKESGGCYLCDIAKENSNLTVYETSDVIAVCPYAALYYYGVNVVTKTHISDFSKIDDNILEQIATVIITVLKALKVIMPNLSFNVCFQLPPYDREKSYEDWHLFVDIIPRGGNFAGFELSTGCHINSKYPETAALELRNIIKELRAYP